MHGWARWVTRSAWFWIVAWVVAAAAIGLTAPSIPHLLEDDRHGFLPADFPSQRALARLREEFPDIAFGSRAVIVFARDDALGPEDRAIISKLSSLFRDKSASLGWRVRSADVAPFLKPLLESGDGRAAIVVVELPAGNLTAHSVARVREIERVLSETATPEGLRVELTGDAAMGALFDTNAKRDVDATTLWAIAAVAAILLLVYRSAVAMFLPLATIGVALVVSLGLIGWAARGGWPLNGLVQMFVVVIVVGTGTDYCLFLFARFREESAARGGDFAGAATAALTQCGPAILASAGTNAAGLATLILGRNRDLHTSGPTIALAVAVAALAVLTFTAAVICVMGRRLIRARRNGRNSEGDGALWAAAARIVTTRTTVVATIVTTILLAGSVLGALKRTRPLYDPLDQFPADSSFVRGAKLYAAHFSAGRPAADVTLIAEFDGRLDDPRRAPALHTALDQLSRDLRRRFPVVRQRDFDDPIGDRRGTAESDESKNNGAISRSIVEPFARAAYLGRSGRTTRIDLALAVEPRSIAAMEMIEDVRLVTEKALRDSPLHMQGAPLVEVLPSGETSVYADMRALRRRDFAVIAVAAVALIGTILVWLIRSVAQAAVLIAATLLTYLATYGMTWFIVREAYGQAALAWQIDFLLFIVVLSLGQDYNIFVATRIREELATHPPREAIALAVRRTGRVVSSCGVIMAATFASMFAGSLMVMKQFAIALSLAMLVDTFVVRPLLVPAAILLLLERKEKRLASIPAADRPPDLPIERS